MSTTHPPTKHLDAAQLRYVKNHATKLADLHPPDTTWKRSDLPDSLRPQIVRFSREGVIEKVGRVQRDQGGTNYLWQVNDEVWQTIQYYADREDALPCGHVGFTNVPDTDIYECNTCEEQYTRVELPF